MADDQSQVPPAQPAPAAAAAAPQAAPPPQTAATPAEKAKRSGQRRRLFAILGVVLVVLAVGYFFYWLLVASHYVSTDNAYVGADVAQVTPLVSGAVTDVRVADTQPVKKGDVLVVIDAADTKVAAERADAQYNQAVAKCAKASPPPSS